MMRNEKQRNGIKILYYRWRQYIIYRESNCLQIKNEKPLKNFETETSLKKLKLAIETQISHFVMYFGRSLFTKNSIHIK